MSEHTDSAVYADTLDGLFRARRQHTPNWPALHYFDRQAQTWRSLDWQTLGEYVDRWQTAIAQLNLRRGDRVAILLRNGPDWVAVEQAALALGLVVVPLYLDDRADNLHYILRDAGVRLLVLTDAPAWRKLAETFAPLADLQHIVVVDGDAPSSNWETTRCYAAVSWLPAHANTPPPRQGDTQALATIVYTSGTTGKPKGVMLSHRNILFVAEASGKSLGIQPQLRFLSFLPLSHTFERTAGYYVPIMYGMQIAYARSIQHLADDLLAMQPDILIAVPRVFERFYERIQEQLRKRSFAARTVFQFAVHIGWQRFLVQQGRVRWNPLLLLWPLLQQRVAAPVQARFGGRIQVIVSGGAALPVSIARLFIGLGIPILQGYGMTETSPVISVNRFDHNDPASVGSPLDGILVRIGAHDELQVQSPGIMLGYWNNHKATHDILMPDGWIHTGDKARLDEGRIYITGRLKDILVMSNGEKVPPADMEDAIKLDPLFSQAIIVGEAKSYLGALVVLNSEHWFQLAGSLHLNPQSPAALDDPNCQKALLQRIAKTLRGFPSYARIRRISVSLEPWTIENGLLTPTLKTKRQSILQHYQRQIDALYA